MGVNLRADMIIHMNIFHSQVVLTFFGVYYLSLRVVTNETPSSPVFTVDILTYQGELVPGF